MRKITSGDLPGDVRGRLVGDPAELAALPSGPVTPLTKSTYLDLTPAGVGFELEKVEGLAVLDGVPGIALLKRQPFRFLQDPATNVIDVSANPGGAGAHLHDGDRGDLGADDRRDPQAGRTLTCTPGAFSGSGGTLEYAYEWLRAGTPITGADTGRLTLASEDVGAAISCRVTAQRVRGAIRTPSTPSTSASTAAVANFESGAGGPFAPIGAPGATGAAGPPGATGATGSTGAKGDRGPAGPLPKVSCKLNRKRAGRKQTISCTVKAGRSSSTRVAARSGGRTIASARVRRGRAMLRYSRRRSAVTILALDARGRIVERVRVTLR